MGVIVGSGWLRVVGRWGLDVALWLPNRNHHAEPIITPNGPMSAPMGVMIGSGLWRVVG